LVQRLAAARIRSAASLAAERQPRGRFRVHRAGVRSRSRGPRARPAAAERLAICTA